MKVEICASNYKSALHAQIGGAHRIELCAHLALGGVTPDYGLLFQVAQNISIDKFVLIRPRSGNFTYSKEEFDQMLYNIDLCKELGYDGIVSGVLHKNNTIDLNRTIELINRARPMSFTFHRAFDWLPDPQDGLQDLLNMGVDRILTSGQAVTALEGLSCIASLLEQAKEEIIILPGGGIQPNNVHEFKSIGCKEVHASLTTLNTMMTPQKITMLSPKFFDETLEWHSDIDKIKRLLKNI